MTVAATLPLAVVMVAGPQIICSFFFATSEKWKSDSLAYVLGGAIGLFLVVTGAYLLAGNGSGDSSRSSTTTAIIVGLLVVVMAYVFHGRKQTDPPKWMGRLESATPKVTIKLGFLLLAFFPSDLLTSIAIGAHLSSGGDPWWHAVPFILLTLLLLALPALAVAALGARAKRELPKIRDWMDQNSWIVSEIVLLFFIAIVLFG